MEVHVVRHIADAVEEDLALLAKGRHGRERLRHRLDREAVWRRHDDRQKVVVGLPVSCLSMRPIASTS